MGILGGTWIAQRVVERQLPRRRTEQVIPAYDLIHAHQRVVHHDGELIREDAVAPPHDEVADRRRYVLDDLAVQRIVERDLALRRAQTPRRAASRRLAFGPLRGCEVAAGSRIAR